MRSTNVTGEVGGRVLQKSRAFSAAKGKEEILICAGVSVQGCQTLKKQRSQNTNI